MSIYRPIDVAAVLAAVVRILRHDHGAPGAHPADSATPCATCALIERAQQVVGELHSDPDAPLFAALEGAGAGDAVSNTVDHLEATILLIAPGLKVDPRALLRAVIVTAQQRLDWGYGPIGGAHGGAAPAPADPPTGAPGDGAADTACAAELAAALDAATVAVEIEAETVAALHPAIDKARAVQLIVQHLRDTGWTT